MIGSCLKLFHKMSKLLNRFRICSKITEKIKLQIKIFHVFEDIKGQNVLFITSDDKVFGFGTNYFGCCGLGHNSVVNEPQIIPELCHKNIKQFFIGRNFTLAHTNDGQVFGWGYNSSGQLGRRHVSWTNQYFKPEIISFPFESVIQLSCGYSHTLVLSCDGRVYGWGDNVYGQIGCGREKGKRFANPIHLEVFIPFSIKILKSCYFCSFALTTDGLVYSWGYNEWCSLGHELGEKECIFEPKLIVNIPKMLFVCPSSRNTYFISNDRDLYFCGLIREVKNYLKIYQTKPKLLNTENKFSSLHSIPYIYHLEGLLLSVKIQSIDCLEMKIENTIISLI